jgi:hypothetical protein
MHYRWRRAGRTALVSAAVVATVAAGCAQAPPATAPTAPKPYEGISLFGVPLTSAGPDEASLGRYEQARRDFEAAPTEDAVVWLGRRAAYLGRYRDAIRIYSDGLERFPDSYRLYRHRGHRYITLRQFGRAIADLDQAAALARGKPLEVEPDGMPNAAGVPVSNTHFNIYYHLGLACYLARDFAKAETAYRECLKWSKNDDSVVAVSDWLYMTLRRAGRVADAATVLAPIRRGMPLLENGAYLDRLLTFKGIVPTEDFARAKPNESASERAIRAYGMGMMRLWEGDRDGAREWFERLAGGGAWASFAAIAAEVELAGLMQAEPDRRSPASTLAAWSLSWNLYDLDLAARLFTTDPPPTYFSSETPGRIGGVDALMAHHKGFGFVPGGKAADNRLWLEDLQVREGGGFASATAVWLFDRDVAGPAPAQRGPVTFVLAKTEDGWRIGHAHFANDPVPRIRP